MQADILDFFIIYMNLNLILQFLFFVQFRHSILNGREFHLTINNIVGRAGRDALGELTTVIGNQVPTGMLLAVRMDCDFDAIDRTVVRPVSRTGNQTIMSFGILFLCGRI